MTFSQFDACRTSLDTYSADNDSSKLKNNILASLSSALSHSHRPRVANADGETLT